MKRTLIQLALVALTTVAANASPLCTSDNWQFYIDNYSGGCLVGDKLFSNFQISASNVAASTINVVPNDPTSHAFEGLKFSSGSWFAFSNGTKDTTLSYTVSAPGPFISAAALTTTGRFPAPTGVITVTETIQQGAIDIPGSPLVASGPSASATLDFIAAGGIYQQTLNVTTQVHVHANAGGQATLSLIDENFTQIAAPEPVQSILIGSGFLMLGLMSRKRRSR